MKHIPIYPLLANTPPPTRLERIGIWLRDHRGIILTVQWIIVLIYAVLLIVPLFYDIPGNDDHILNHITVFAEFCFWGIWWPFVLVSMVLFGRLWCGIMCPEGALSEWASRHGLGLPIPRWIRWPGWPFVGFVILTTYGQLVSVYQYPHAAMLILGGSTLLAILLGFLYARGKRVWCRYLCPVSGVFQLLAKIAPLHYAVNQHLWDIAPHRTADGHKIPAPNCAPMLNIRNMSGAADCHMCGRCAGYRNATALTKRPMTEEIVKYGARSATIWQSLLIIFGLLGIAIGAFHWTVSPYFVAYRSWLGGVLIEKEWYWALDTNTPWWLLTNYPENQDVFTWMDGFCIATYIFATAIIMASLISICLFLTICIAKQKSVQAFNHIAQALIPISAVGVFLGLSATTVNLLKHDRYPTDWANSVRLICLIIGTIGCLILGWKIIRSWQITNRLRAYTALLPYLAALCIINAAWGFMFWWW